MKRANPVDRFAPTRPRETINGEANPRRYPRMTTRYRALLVGVLLGGGLLALGADPAQEQPVKTAVDFTLRDTQGKAVTLGQFKDKKAVVLVFVGTECPVNNQFLPRLN